MTSTSTFQEVQFPPEISYGSKGGSGFNTTIFETTAGYEQRNINWSQSRGKWTVNQGIKSLNDMEDLIQFFNAMRGRAYAFRFKDWADYVISGEQIAIGDGTTTTFQLTKNYSSGLSGGADFIRTIKKPVPGTLAGFLVGDTLLDPSAYTFDTTSGIFTLKTAPAAALPVVVGYVEFDVPARFDTDALDISQDFFQVQSWEGIAILEVRV